MKEAFGKQAYVHRFVDTSDIRARFQSKTIAHLPKQPADYHVTVKGAFPFYAEVKGTKNKSSFSYRNFEQSQLAAMKRVVAAGGDYKVFIYHVDKNCWFHVAANLILLDMDQGGKSFPLNEKDITTRWVLGDKYGIA